MKATILIKKCSVHIEHTLTEAERDVGRIDHRIIKKRCPGVAIVLMTADTLISPDYRELPICLHTFIEDTELPLPSCSAVVLRSE